MKKLIMLFMCMLLLTSFASAWSATRTINGNNVTVTITQDSSSDAFTIVENVSLGVTIISYPVSCGLASGVLTCDSEDSTKRIINYMTSGTGSVSGVISQAYPPFAIKATTGDTQLGTIVSLSLKINEFANALSSGTDWVEIYNAGASSVNLSDCDLNDTTSKMRDLNGTILPGDFAAFDVDSRLNAGSDTIKLICNNVIIDQISYPTNVSEPGLDNSTGRYGDGTNNWVVFTNPTKGSSNIITIPGDITAPIISNVNSIAKLNNATITWVTDENSNSSVNYGKTTSLGNKVSSTNFVSVHSMDLVGLDSTTLYYFRVQSCDSSGNCAESSLKNFTTLTDSGSMENDDLMVNYLRGKIVLEGLNAFAGVQYQVEVLNGANAGSIFIGTVDNNVPALFEGIGYFDTLDNIAFNTGDSYRISVLDLGYECSSQGVFDNGGNGKFEEESSLISLNCRPDNYLPVLQLVGDKIINENDSLEFYVNASDLDNDTLTYSIIGLPFGASFVNQTFSWQTDYNDAGEYYIRVNVSDGKVSVYEDILITVNNVNRAPVINMANNYSITENVPANVSIVASDPDGDGLLYSIINENTSEVDCEIVENVIYFIPASDFNGLASCELEVSDGDLTVTKNLSLNVHHINQPPMLLINIPFIEWQEGLILNDYLNLSVYFRDSDSNLTYSVSGNNHINVTLNDNLVSFSASLGWYGTEVVTFRASDGEYNLSSNLVNLTVMHVGVAPSFLPLTCISDILEDTSYNCTLDVNNTEPVAFVFNVTSQSNMNCNIAGGKLYYTSVKDYNGLASCEVEVKNIYGSDRVNLSFNVLPVNDAPILNPIGNRVAMENSTLIINVSASDVDVAYGDTLLYFVDALPSPFSTLGYSSGVFEWPVEFGERGVYNVTFRVVDSSGVNDTQRITITILKNNRPPVLQDMDGILIGEETEANFIAVATDEDNDNLTFSIVQESTNKVDCSINSTTGVGSVKGSKDFYGVSNCTVRVSDGMNYSDKTFEITVTNVQDEPVVIYSPTTNPRLVNGSTQNFVVSASDVDNDPLSIIWFLNGMNVSTYWNYLFNQVANGNYNLTMSVSDGTSSISHEWNVFVGSLFDFSCSEVKGYTCNGNQTCNGNVLDTYDSVPGNICCSQQCSIKPPEFNDADRCEVDKVKSIEVKISDPDSDEEFDLGEDIEVKVKVTNNDAEDEDVDVVAYLYDLTEDESFKEQDESIDIDSGDTETLNFVFNTSTNLDLDHDYALLVVADGDYGCSDNYVPIVINRNKDDLIFKQVNIDPETAVCGDSVDVRVKIQNIGSRDQDNIYFSLENSDLGIKEKTDVFELEKYDDSDTNEKTLSFVVPETVSAGTYKLNLKLDYGDYKTELIKDIQIGECKKQESSSTVIGVSTAKDVETKQAIFKKLSDMQLMFLLIFVLFVAIIITVLAIIVVVRR